MASKSDTFYCPHCGVKLTKSAAASILGDADAGMFLGNLPPAVTCPGCGGAIDTKKMIAGDYDYQVGIVGCLIFAAIMVGGTSLATKLTGYGIVASASIAFGAILVLGLLYVAAGHWWRSRRR